MRLASGGTFENAMGGTFVSATGGTFHSATPGTFVSAMGVVHLIRGDHGTFYFTKNSTLTFAKNSTGKVTCYNRLLQFAFLEVGGVATGLGDGGVMVEGGAEIDDVAEIEEMEEAVVEWAGSAVEIVVNCAVGILPNTIEDGVSIDVAVPDAGDDFGIGVAVLELGYEVGDFHKLHS